MTRARRVVVESPYTGDRVTNTRYLRAALRDCLLRGEAPYASHGLYTQPGVLDDDVPDERALGIDAGFAFREACDATVVYVDLGYSRGMTYGIEHARRIGHPVEIRSLSAEMWQIDPAAGIDAYQAWCERTHDRSLPSDVRLTWNGLGVAGEAGEVADMIKKTVFHRRPLDKPALVKELGDVVWYVAAIASNLGIRMSDVVAANVAKLTQRFPDGWSPDAAEARADEVKA